MIRHIVFFSARDKADIDEIVEGLSVLAKIPHSLHFEISRNMRADRISNDIDVVVYGEFADEEALAAFKDHPLYQQSTATVRPLRELRFAADYDTQAVAASSGPGRGPHVKG